MRRVVVWCTDCGTVHYNLPETLAFMFIRLHRGGNFRSVDAEDYAADLARMEHAAAQALAEARP